MYDKKMLDELQDLLGKWDKSSLQKRWHNAGTER